MTKGCFVASLPDQDANGLVTVPFFAGKPVAGNSVRDFWIGAPVLTTSVGNGEMSVTRLDRKAVGRGGSARRLHQIRPVNLQDAMGPNQDRRLREEIDALRHGTAVIGPNLKGSTTTFPSPNAALRPKRSPAGAWQQKPVTYSLRDAPFKRRSGGWLRCPIGRAQHSPSLLS